MDKIEKIYRDLEEEAEEWAENEAYGKSNEEFDMAYKGFKAGVEWQKDQILNWVKEKQERHKGYSNVELVVTLKDLVEKVL